MARTGTILKLNGAYAIISTTRRGICDGCAEKSGCSFDNALGKSVPEEIIGLNLVQGKPGDIVEFDFPNHRELKTALMVWLVPLIGLLVGAFIGNSYHLLPGLDSEISTLVGCVTGLALGFGCLMIIERFFTDHQKSIPVLERILEQSCQKEK